MSQINVVGAELAERGLVRAATDVTGFGLLGHLASMCRASGVAAEIDPASMFRRSSKHILDLIDARLHSRRHPRQPLKREQDGRNWSDASSRQILAHRRANQRRFATLRSRIEARQGSGDPARVT